MLSLLWVTPTVNASSLELYSAKEIIFNINNNNDDIYFRDTVRGSILTYCTFIKW